ncbi:cation:proton antiporter [Candidatus Woesearchaeota archaeon]|nr:cation:proton antiporter [Candidatus Woesearchaeota archaeon]
MELDLFFTLGIVLIFATGVAIIIRFFKQPPILSYILAGLVIGPSGLALIEDIEVINTLSLLGIAFMLFIVGLELDFRKLRQVGKAAVIAGIAQIAATTFLGYLLALWLGFNHIVSLYVSLALAFSSTLIVVKILSDKKEIETLHGRLMIGILLVQDFVAILALALLATVGSSFQIYPIFIALVKGAVLFSLTALLIWLAPYLFSRIAKSQELLFLSSVSWLFIMIFLADFLDYSIAIGAFLAGISLAASPFHIEIVAKVRSLRDFFATIFFVSLGMQIVLGAALGYIWITVLFILLVMVIDPLSVMIPLSLMGYDKKISFLSSIGISQLSEFSLILIAQGFLLGVISQEVVSVVMVVTAITIAFTTYLMQYQETVYRVCKPYLGFLDLLRFRKEEYVSKKADRYDVVLAGHNRIGYSIRRKLKNLDMKVLVVDYNPEIIEKIRDKQTFTLYGDIGDEEVLDAIDFKHAKMVVSTVPSIYDSLLLLEKVKDANKKAVIMLTANSIEDALELYKAGADYVILPHFLGGEYASGLLERFTGKASSVLPYKLQHIKELVLRKEIGHEHPLHS